MIDYFTFEIIDQQGLIQGSDRVREQLFNGVCIVSVNQQECGSGFLFRFRTDQNIEMFGFLTCYHVIRNRALQPLPGPAQITIRFDSNPPVQRTLTQAQIPNREPIVSPAHDIYYLEVSQQFRNDMQAHGIPFYESTDPFGSHQVWIAQYPGPTGQRHIANATMTAGWLTTGPLIHHIVSTGEGSSGSPLLLYMLEQDTLRTIGMHQGGLRGNPNVNVAASIANIMHVLNYRIQYAADPPFPIHTPAPAFEASGIALNLLLLSKIL